MSRLLQINVTANWGSTGKIAEQIGIVAQSHGWESFIACGRHINPSKNRLVKIGSVFNVYEHYAEGLLLDNEGLASRYATMTFLKELDAIKPDVVHLHIIHDHFINYRILLGYLAKKKIPVVWTQHDQWWITGHCACVFDGCERWKDECHDCPFPKRYFLDRSRRNHQLKRRMSAEIPSLTVVPVSDWLAGIVRQSHLKNRRIEVIPNGVDLSIFRPQVSDVRNQYGIQGGKIVLLGVASVWVDRKGFKDYIELSHHLPENCLIVMVGVSKGQKKVLPRNIVGLERMQDQYELARLYSAADILLSLSRSETFGMTIVEAYACGTPCIVYDNTAQPEIVKPDTGRVVRTGDIAALTDTICEMVNANFKSRHSADCRKFAEECFDKDKCFEKYMRLYDSLLK